MKRLHLRVAGGNLQNPGVRGACIQPVPISAAGVALHLTQARYSELKGRESGVKLVVSDRAARHLGRGVVCDGFDDYVQLPLCLGFTVTSD